MAAESEPPRDVQVITAVLQDLLSYSGQKSPVLERGSPPDEILFSPEPRWWLQMHDVLHDSEGDPCAALPPAEAAAVREAVADLEARVQSKTWSGVRPRDPRIRLWGSSRSGSDSDKGLSAPDRPISARPPGFSKDGTVAVVCLSIPWSMHSSLATFVLTRTDAGWTVRVRQFVYYL